MCVCVGVHVRSEGATLTRFRLVRNQFWSQISGPMFGMADCEDPKGIVAALSHALLPSALASHPPMEMGTTILTSSRPRPKLSVLSQRPYPLGPPLSAPTPIQRHILA